MYTVIIHDEYIRRSGKIVSIVVSIEIPLRHASSAANSRINERLGEGGGEQRKAARREGRGRGKRVGEGFKCGTRTCNKWNVPGLLIKSLALIRMRVWGEERNNNRRCIEFV